MLDGSITPLAEEEIEGLGDPIEDLDSPDYSLDDIMVRPETRTVAEVVRRINANRLFLAPDFQRDFVWSPKKQSKLIESCIMRIPLPVLYVAEGNDGRIIVVDGLQRLTTFVRFFSDELTLTGLGKAHPLNGKTFSTIPIPLQERVEGMRLTLFILDKDAPSRARLDIFERVNSGSVLTRQQMRNAMFNGHGTKWLYEMSTNDRFLEATRHGLNSKTMRDREAINRFAAFHIFGWQAYGNGDMDGFLSRAIERLNESDEDFRHRLSMRFLHSMKANEDLFGAHAFRKSLIHGIMPLSVINISLFDVLSCALSTLHETVISEHRSEISSLIVSLLDTVDFEHAITVSTNSTRQVRTRFEMIDGQLSNFPRLEYVR